MNKLIKMESMESEGGNTKTPSKSGTEKTLIRPKKDKKVRGNQCIKHFFTWNNYPENAIKEFLEVMESLSKKYCFQEETGEDGTPHLQGCLWLKSKMRWSAFKLPNTIHWESVKDWDASVVYCSKEETRTGKQYKKGFPKELKLISVLKVWQQQIIDIIQGEVDDRLVYWIYDKEGCNGKTVFSKYLYAKMEAIIATAGGNKDIACLLSIVKGNGRDLNEKTTFVFNFPRSTEGISYKAIESVKDGLITSVKYESSTLVFNCPHVICFSNELPNMAKLSADRWRIFTIEDEKLSRFTFEEI